MTDPVFGALKIIDCGSYVAGPAAATVFSDLGAEVVKIEPLDGDPLRQLAPVYPSFFWRMDSRNKKGIAIDLKHPTGLEVLERLVRTADVFLTNYRPSLIQRLNLEYETLKALNPRLVYAQITGYGLQGDESERTAFDSTAWWGRSGLQDWIRPHDGDPALSAAGMGDHATSMALFGGISAALYRRELTGEGTRVYTSLVANGAWSHSMSIQAAAAGANWAFEHPRPPRAEGHLNQLYRTQDDRTILINVLNPAKEYLPLLRSLGIDYLIEDERFVNHRTAYENMSELVIEVRRAIRSMSLVDLRSRFDAHQVTYGFAQKTSEVLDDPQLWANDVLVSPEDPVEGYDRTVSSPIWIDGVEKVRPKLAPEIGEHNEEVLSGIGFTAAEIDNMRIEGVIGNTVGEVPGRNK